MRHLPIVLASAALLAGCGTAAGMGPDLNNLAVDVRLTMGAPAKAYQVLTVDPDPLASIPNIAVGEATPHAQFKADDIADIQVALFLPTNLETAAVTKSLTYSTSMAAVRFENLKMNTNYVIRSRAYNASAELMSIDASSTGKFNTGVASLTTVELPLTLKTTTFKGTGEDESPFGDIEDGAFVNTTDTESISLDTSSN